MESLQRLTIPDGHQENQTIIMVKIAEALTMTDFLITRPMTFHAEINITLCAKEQHCSHWQQAASATLIHEMK